MAKQNILVILREVDLQAYNYSINNKISFTKSAKLHGIDYEKLFRMEREGFEEINGQYFISNEDLQITKEAINYYINNEKVSFKEISNKYNIGIAGFKSRLKIFGIDIKDNKKKYNRRIFKDIDNSEKAYWLGFIWSDGNIYKNELRLKIGEKDRDHLDKFIKFMEGESSLSIVEEKHCITGNILVKVICCDKDLISDLKDKGLDYNKTGNESIPLIHEAYISHFIRGYFDGDGHIRRTMDSIGFVSGYEILNFIKNNLISNCKVNNIKISNDKSSNIYRMQWGAKRDINAIINYMYKDNTVCLDRKLKLCNDFKAIYSEGI